MNIEELQQKLAARMVTLRDSDGFKAFLEALEIDYLANEQVRDSTYDEKKLFEARAVCLYIRELTRRVEEWTAPRPTEEGEKSPDTGPRAY